MNIRQFASGAARLLALATVIWAAAALPWWADSVLATTYYVDAASPGGNGLTWGTAFTTVQAGINAAMSGDTVEVAGGTYNEILHTVSDGVTVAGSTASGHTGTVTVKGAAGQIVLSVSHQTTWRRITFDGSANADGNIQVVMITAGNPTFDQCVIGPGQQLLSVGSGGATFTRCTFQEARRGNAVYGPIIDIAAGASASVTFDYCLFGDMEFGNIQVQSASRVDINNCLLAGFAGAVLYMPSGAVVSGGIHLQNCLVLGNGFAANALIDNQATLGAASVTLANCLVQPMTPVNMTTAKYSGDVTETNPLTPGSPKLTHGRREALLSLGIDDASNIGFWAQVADMCKTHNIKTTLALNTADVASAADWNTIQSRVNDGHEVAAHTAHHVYLPETRLLTIGYAGPETGATVTVASSGTQATTLTVAVPDNPAVGFSLDLTSAAYDTIGEVQAAIAGHAGFTSEVISVPDTVYTTALVLSRDLNAVTDVSILNTTATLSRNDTQFFADEIIAPKTEIESKLTAAGSASAYACTSFVYPYLDTDAAVLAAVEQAGYTAARGGYHGSYAMGGYYAAGQPGGYDVLNIWSASPGDIFGRSLDAATLQARVSAVLEWMKFTGVAISLYSHGADTYSLAEWTALVTLLAADTEVQFVTLGELGQYVASHAQSHTGTTYVRTSWPAVADYMPQDGSPLINAGAVYGVAKTDFAGNNVPAGTIPTVGLYQRTGSTPVVSVNMEGPYLLLLLQ